MFKGDCVNFIKSLWRGERGLAFTFWGMGIGVKLIVGVIDINLFLYVNDFFLNGPLMLIFSLYMLVCIWRSSDNYIAAAKEAGTAKSSWGYLAKIMAIIGVLQPVMMIVFNQIVP